eukprot:165223-Hanusia_phi.AAC.2
MSFAVLCVNYTGPENNTILPLHCSPHGKLKQALWVPASQILNITVEEDIFVNEPFRILFDSDVQLVKRTDIIDFTEEEFLESLFANPPPKTVNSWKKKLDAERAEMLNKSAILDRAHGWVLKDDMLPPIRPGTIMQLTGLEQRPEYNGKLVAMVGRSMDRYQVQLIETGKTILIRPQNLNDAQEEFDVGSVSKAESQAWILLNQLYPTTTTNVTFSDKRLYQLSAEDIEILDRLNLSSYTNKFFWDTQHCDGGLGKQIIPPLGTRDDEMDEIVYVPGSIEQQYRDRFEPRQAIIDFGLQTATLANKPSSIRELVAAGANLSTRVFPGCAHGAFLRTPLHVACYEGKEEAALTLMELGADVNARDETEATPLHLAGTKGRTRLVKELLERGGDPTLKNKFNHTCIHRAVFWGQYDAAQLMLEKAGKAYDKSEIRDLMRYGVMLARNMEKYKHLD